MYDVIGKRVMDVVVSAAALLLLSPVFLVVAVLVRFKLGGPVFFLQRRGGYLGRPFDVVKFRTMTDATDGDGVLRSDSERLTRFGRGLRASSLDELPGLLNVLKGEMSLVGPRPLIYDYMELYTPEQARRHEVRPGITGWAQVNGRNAISWEAKFALDVWYVDNRGFWLDMKILLMTVRRIFLSHGITAEGSASAERFTG